MKKYLFLLVFLFPFFAHAEGGFLNIITSITNDNGGSLQPSEVQYTVNYDNTSVSLSGPLGQSGYPQTFGFPEHPLGNGSLIYSVVPVTPAGYSLTTSDKGCSGEIPGGDQYHIQTCVLYLHDVGYPLPVSPKEVITPTIVSSTPQIEAQVQTIVDNSELIRSLQAQLISLLTQLIQLLQQQLQTT